MEVDQTVTLRHSDTSWLVEFRFNQRMQAGFFSSTGWSAFTRETRLRVRDICVFELISCRFSVFKVSIFRSSGPELINIDWGIHKKCLLSMNLEFLIMPSFAFWCINEKCNTFFWVYFLFELVTILWQSFSEDYLSSLAFRARDNYFDIVRLWKKGGMTLGSITEMILLISSADWRTNVNSISS